MFLLGRVFLLHLWSLPDKNAQPCTRLNNLLLIICLIARNDLQGTALYLRTVLRNMCQVDSLDSHTVWDIDPHHTCTYQSLFDILTSSCLEAAVADGAGLSCNLKHKQQRWYEPGRCC